MNPRFTALRSQILKNLNNAVYLVGLKKPHVFLRYVEKYVKARVFGKITPRQIDIALTFDCNLACDHCFTAPLFRRDEKEMDVETLKKVAEECRKLGITVIHFTGGEILMREDLETIIGLFEPRKNVIYIQSNGTLASYERLLSLKKAGLDFFGVSLEYPDKKKQDDFRHYKGYYDKALSVLEDARRAGLQTSVNITLDRHLIRWEGMPGWISSLGRLGHIVYGNLPVPVGRFSKRKDLLWLGDERTILKDLTRRFPFFRTEFDSNFGPYGCPAMKEKIYLCAYGDVLACPYIHVSLGNVKEESLSDIHRRGLSFKVFNTYHDHCLAAENQTFIRRIIDKTLDFSRQPVFYKAFEKELRTHGFDTGNTGHAPAVNPDEWAQTMTQDPDPKKTLLTLENTDCPSCGSAARDHVITAPDFETDHEDLFRVVRCTDCGLSYTSPRPSMDDLFRHFYQDNYICYTTSGLADTLRETYLCRSRYKALKSVFSRLRPDGTPGRFLDVGCSYGYFLSYLKENTNWVVKGCEPSRDMAEKARERGLDVTAETLADAGYESESFDLVYMSHVLEHVPDLGKTVDEVFRILRPGGIFITENPDMEAPIRPWFGSAWWGYHLPRHLSHFTFETMTRLLTHAGFRVEVIKPCFRPGPIAWSVRNLLKSKGYPERLASFFGVQNPVFVALCGIPALIFLKKGHTDMMETLAVKPEGKTP
jgi:MoaA/NifB/PqqE/SkfB family radical SAM enzyme/SAM-dependent methyltransferase